LAAGSRRFQSQPAAVVLAQPRRDLEFGCSVAESPERAPDELHPVLASGDLSELGTRTRPGLPPARHGHRYASAASTSTSASAGPAASATAGSLPRPERGRQVARERAGENRPR